MCFLPNSRYDNILIGKIKDFLQKLDAFCFNYQHVVCLYTLFKYRFRGKNVVKSEHLFENLQGAVDFNLQNRGVDRMPRTPKKRLLREKYKNYLLRSFQKTKSTQTSGSVFADRIEQGKKTKFEIELIKFIDFSRRSWYFSIFLNKTFAKIPFSEFQRILYKPISSASYIVVIPIKNPSAIKNAITKKIVPKVRQTHATHS